MRQKTIDAVEKQEKPFSGKLLSVLTIVLSEHLNAFSAQSFTWFTWYSWHFHIILCRHLSMNISSQLSLEHEWKINIFRSTFSFRKCFQSIFVHKTSLELYFSLNQIIISDASKCNAECYTEKLTIHITNKKLGCCFWLCYQIIFYAALINIYYLLFSVIIQLSFHLRTAD